MKKDYYKHLLFFVILMGCTLTTFAQTTTITSFTPLSAKPGDVITLTGTNFNTTTTNNIVFFGATRATVTAATATSVTVTVPTGATYAPITLLNTGTSLAAYSMSNFTPTYSPAKTTLTATDFPAKQDFPSGTNPFSVALGDLDGDGKPDLAVANFNSNTVSVYQNTSTSGSIGSGSFATKVDFATGARPISVAIGDLDGDGKPDLAVANFDASTVSVLRNTATSGSIGSGSFATKVDFATGPVPYSVALGDLDGDGKPDIAVANINSNTVSVLRNTSTSGSIGSGSFEPKVDFTTRSQPYSVAIGDLDGDGKPDLAVANLSSNTVSVLRNTATSGSISSGSFATKVDFTTGSNPRSVAIGDVDGDGKPDLAVANQGSSRVSVLRNTTTSGSIGSGSFEPKVDFITGANPYSVSLGDLDGDGKPDLAVANSNSNTVSILRNTATSGSIGSGSFESKVDFATGSVPYSVAIGDLDGDGKPDLAVANGASNTVSVLRNADLPPTITSFTPLSAKPGDAVTLTGTNFSTTATNNIVFFGAARATVTAATATSVTVTVPTGATYAPITLLNMGTSLAAYSLSNFTPTYSPAKTAITATDFQAKQDFASGTKPFSVAMGDLDGDGKPDLAVANSGSNTVSVYRNTSTSGSIGSGSFAAKVDFATGSQPISVAIGDLDGDGKPDLAVANQSSNTVSVLRNTSSGGSIGSGSFATKVDFATGSGSQPYSVAIGDLDGDGKPDLAVANNTSNTVSVIRNTSSSGSIVAGSFANKVDFATGNFPNSVAIGDLDGDGKPDLVVAIQSSSTVSVYRNTATSGSIGSGSFAAKQDFATGFSPVSVAIGDLDGDGKPDLAVANQNSNTVSVIRNTSTSGSIGLDSFAANVDFATGSQPRSVAIGDLDGDGKPDLAVANNGTATVSVFRNTSTSGSIGSGSFESKVDFATGSVPISVAIGDLDGDGKPDLAVTNFSSNTVSVLRNADLPPTITSFTPLSAKPGDAVTLTGTNFSTTAGNNIVFFGATRATVTAATATSVTVTVPTGATYAPITLLNTGTSLAAYSMSNFTPTYSLAKTAITATDFQAKQDFTTGTNTVPFSVAIGDLDGDGKSDLVVVNNNLNTVSVYRNTTTSGSIGSGSFAAKVDFTTGGIPFSIAIGDLDGDGKPDLAVANNGSNSVSIFRNTTSSSSINSGSFATKVDFTTGSNPVSVAIGDLDGDGKPDLAVVNFNSNSVSVIRNTAISGSINSVSFATKVDFTTETNPYSVAIGDLDRDGKPELAVANFGSNTVSVFRNTASSGTIDNGSLAAKVDFTTGSNPLSVAIGDLDGDGKPDLAVANNGSTSVSVFHNTATNGSIITGSFADKVDFTTGSLPRSVTIGDVDGDGKPELAIVNIGTNMVSVFRNTSSSGSMGSGSFATKVDFTTGSAPISVALGDLDGDGKPDLAVANQSSNTVSVLRNADIPPPTITSFSPTSAKPGDAVTLTGTNFSTTAGNNIVFFGATRATVTAATATSVTVTVPTGATYAPITLLNTETSLAAYSLSNFTPTYSPAKTSLTATDFQAKQDFNTGINPQSVAMGDLDGDGKPDLAVANSGTSTVSVYRNTATSGSIGSGSFAAKVDFATGPAPYSVAIGDLDGDGKPELAVANQGSNAVSVFRNTATSGSIGTGSFATALDFATGFSPVSVAIGDLDGDGKPDLAVANNGATTVSVLRNTATSGSIGTGSFATALDFATGFSPVSVAIGDLDGDGKPDLAVANQSSNTVSVMRNTATSGSIGSGSFATKVDFATGSGSQPISVAIGDVDGDGKPDLAVANRNSYTVSVYRNTATSGSIGSGSFATKVDFATGSVPYSVAIGDLDGDGKPDLAVANGGSGTVSVLRNTATSGSMGSGSFATKVDFTTGSAPISVALGDLDGDGKPDLAVANQSSNTVSVLRNADIPPPTITSFSPTSAKPGDAVTLTGTNFSTTAGNNIVFFGATRATVTAATATSVTVTVPTGATYAPITLLNTETSLAAYSLSNFTPTYSPAKTSLTATDFQAKQDFNTGINSQSVAIGDLDGDGKPDLAVANRNLNTVSVYRNTSTSGSIGSGSFAAKQDFATGSFPIFVAIGDLDGDGKPDLAVANNTSHTVSVLRNTATSGSIGSGSFAPTVDLATGLGPLSVAIGDLDGDGKPDLAVANINSNTVSVLRNKATSGSISTGSFAPAVDFATGSQPFSVAMGDLDGDGKPDLAVSNQISTTVSVMRNTATSGSIGSSSFETKVDLATGTNPRSVAIGDLDGDGKLDLAVVNFNSNTVSVYRNTATSGSISTGSFATKVDFTTGSQPRSVAMGDLDGDGKPDLAVTNQNSNTVSILRNTATSGSIGSGSFESKVDFTTGSGPISVAIGDLDGDGKPDLAVANFFSTTVSVLRNANFSADLSALTLSVGTLSPTFAATTTAYTASVDNATTGLIVTPTLADPNASVNVNGTIVVSGTASGTVALNEGSNTITVVVTAQNATTKTYTITVLRSILPTFSAIAPICSGATLSALPTISNNEIVGTWSPVLNNTLTTTYTFTPDAGQNAISTTITITVNANPIATASSNAPICAGTSLNLTGSGIGTYAWSGPNAFSATDQSPSIANATVAASGVYTLTVTNANSCTSTATTSVTVNENPIATASSNAPICAGTSLNLTSGGIGTYAWSGPSFTSTSQSPTIANATVAASGVYTLTVTNANSCTSTATTSVTVNENPIATASSNSPICAGTSLNLTGSGIGTYAWSGPNSFSATDQSPTIANATVAASGIYTLTVTNANSCTATATTSVTVNANPIATASSNAPICAGTSLNLTGGGEGTYAWSGPNSFSATDQSPSIANATVAASGVYTLTVTNANSCTSTATTSVTVNENPIATASSNAPICAGTSLNLTSGGIGTYAWSGPSFTSTSQSPTIANATVAASGVYTLTVTNANSCTSTATTSVTVNENPIATASSNSPICAGTSLNLTGSGIGTYAWSGPNSFSATDQSPTIANATVAASGIYTLTVTNANSCTATATTSVTVNANPIATASSNAPICAGTSLNLMGSGIGTYAWSGPNSFSATDQSPTIANATVAASGIYTLTVTNANSCTATATTSVTVNANPIATASSNAPICAGTSLNLTGGGIGTYAWSGPNSFSATDQSPTIANATVLATGTYMITVTNVSGCTSTATTSVTVNALPTATASSNSPICAGTSLNLTGGGIGTYAWSGPNAFSATDQSPTIANATVAASGTYMITVTNVSGCTSTATTSVTVNALPTATASSNSPICAGTSLNLTGSGIGTYAWSGPNAFSATDQSPTIANATVAASGVYTLTVTNANSCTATATTSVTVNANPIATASSNAPICAGTSLNLTGGGEGTYAWSGPNSFSATDQSPTITNATVLATGTYMITVTNVSGCTSTATTSVTLNALPTATASSNSPICAGTSLNLTGGGIGTYAWSGPNSFSATDQSPTIANATVAASGVYTLTVTNANSCTATATTSVTVNANPIATASSNAPICAGTSLNLTGGGIGTYAWSGPNSFSATDQSPTIANATVAASGVYTLTVTNANSCTATATTSVTVNANPIATASINAPICAGTSLNLTGGGIGTYAWSGPNSFSATDQSPTIANATVAASGTYMITVTNVSGCTSTATTSVTVNANPIATASSNAPICAGTSLNLTGGGIGTYAWNGPNSYISTAQSPSIPSATASMSGIYTITVTNTNGCTNTATTSVTVNPVVTTPTPQANTQIIFGASITLTATGCSGVNDVLKWYKSSDNTLATMPVSPTATTNYYAKCETTLNGITCISGNSTDVTVTVLQPQPPVATGATICTGGSVTLTATGCTGSTGTFVLKWYLNATDALVTMPVSPTTNTDYYAKCEQTFNSVSAISAKSNVVTVTVLNPLAPVATGGTIYLGNSITLTATGCTGAGFTIRWYQTADNGLVTMPVSPSVTTQYYAKCEQTANTVACLSVKSNDVTVTVVNRIFVDVTKIAAPIQNGNSWATAYGNLQTGLSAAAAVVVSAPAEVWVAQGTYKPTTTTTKTIYFNIPNNLKVYGGFAGTENALNDRNFRTNTTILSGDIGTVNLASDNSYHVVTFDGSSNTTVLDGFTIQGGYANFDSKGVYTAPNNITTSSGTIETGGGIVVQNAGSPLITNCTIINNSGVAGGGIYVTDASKPSINFCKIMGNQAGFGSGIYFQDGSQGVVSNTLISGNRGIGAIYNNTSNPILTNCTLSGNGGYNGGIFNSNAQPVVKNSIIWGNLTQFNDTQSIVTYSIIQGGYSGIGNLSMDPKFVNQFPEGLSPTITGDYHLQATSLAIDRGDNGNISLTDKDLDGNLRRFAGGRVDMGTYEFQGTATATLVISVQTGNWESNSTWDVGRVPQLGDYVIIDRNHVITINGEGTANNIEYRDNSVLKFGNANAKIKTGN